MKKSYYAVIPANVRYDKSLVDGAKLLYGEITALCNEKGYCWAGDSYFVDLYGVSRSTIQRWFKQLEEKEFIHRKILYKKGTRKIEHRYTYLRDNPILKNETPPIPKNATDNITSTNTTVNTTSNKNIVEKLDIPFSEIINYLNLKTGKKYRATTKKTQSLIKARFNEKFKLDDFKKVIDTKVIEWINDKNMSQYLRPETLFGTKFESYLNQGNGNNNPNDPKEDGYDYGF